MKIITMEEARAFVSREAFHPFPLDQLALVVKDEKGHNKTWEPLAELRDVCYNHNPKQVAWAIEQVGQNCLAMKSIIEDTTFVLSPYPSLGFANATCYSSASRKYPAYIVFWARPTQIPSFMTDYIVSHELGHVFEAMFIRRAARPDKGDWDEYLELRHAPRKLCSVYTGREDSEGDSIYEDIEDFIDVCGKAEDFKGRGWKDRPAEWFAEDWRAVYGYNPQGVNWDLEIPPPDENIFTFMKSMAAKGPKE